MSYHRKLKLQLNIASGATGWKSALTEYSSWVCEQAPSDVVSVRLVKRSVRQLEPKQWRRQPGMERAVQRKTVWEGPCQR
jgi:hypothetical protein